MHLWDTSKDLKYIMIGVSDGKNGKNETKRKKTYQKPINNQRLDFPPN